MAPVNAPHLLLNLTRTMECFIWEWIHRTLGNIWKSKALSKKKNLLSIKFLADKSYFFDCQLTQLLKAWSFLLVTLLQVSLPCGGPRCAAVFNSCQRQFKEEQKQLFPPWGAIGGGGFLFCPSFYAKMPSGSAKTATIAASRLISVAAGARLLTSSSSSMVFKDNLWLFLLFGVTTWRKLFGTSLLYTERLPPTNKKADHGSYLHTQPSHLRDVGLHMYR